MRRSNLAAALAVTASLAAVAACGGSSPKAAHVVPTVPAPAGAAAPFTTTATTEPAPVSAPTPRNAVERYVAAEVAGDTAASYALLSDDERAAPGRTRRGPTRPTCGCRSAPSTPSRWTVPPS